MRLVPSSTRQLHRKPLPLMVQLVLLVASGTCSAASEDTQFDTRFLSGGDASKLDISHFSQANAVLPGVYPVEVTFNGEWKSREDIRFAPVATDGGKVHPCLDRVLLIQLGVAFQKFETTAPVATGDCAVIGGLVPDATASFDAAEQRLDIKVPQAYVNRNARGYVDPSLWDAGINAGLLNYRYNTYRSERRNSTSTSSYLSLDAGVNLGKWHLRHSGAYSHTSGAGGKYQDFSNYVQRDIPALGAQLYLGDTYTTGDQFDSVRVRGARLATDERMLPNSQSGYAPIIRGSAETNAQVSIRQNGQLLYQTSVAPGPFEIDDLNPTGYGGDLEVTVTEADGRENQFTVPYAATPNLLREGQQRYSLTAGELRDATLRGTPTMMQGTWQYGASNFVTTYLGGTKSEGYTAFQFGSAFNTTFGAVSVDLTASRASLPVQTNIRNGHSLQFRYAKNFTQTGTSFALGAYRYSTSGYLGLLDAVRIREWYEDGHDVSNYDRARSRFDITMDQRLGTRGSIYLSGSTQNYWNNRRDMTSYTFGYNGTWRSVNYGISLQRTQVRLAETAASQDDMRVQFTLSVPLGGQTRRTTLNATAGHDRSGSDARLGVSGSLGQEGLASYSANLSRSSAGNVTTTLNAGYQAPVVDLDAGYSRGSGYNAVSLGASGGVVLHRDGLTLSQSLGDTVGLVHAPGAEGARIESVRGVRVDADGHAVVPYLQPYRMNAVDVDPRGSSVGTEFRSTRHKVAPRLGSVVWLDYETTSGKPVMIDATMGAGQALPFGAEVADVEGNLLGYVGQGSRLFVRSPEGGGTLTVKWGKGPEEHCAISLPSMPGQAKNSAVEVLDLTCVPIASLEAGVPLRTLAASNGNQGKK